MDQTSRTLVLNEGKTLNYLIPVLICGIAAAFCFVFFPLWGILFAIAAILFGLVENGLEFNLETMEYRKFESLFDSKWGEWKKIQDPDSFHLVLSVENNSYKTPMLSAPAFYGNGPAVKSKSITYDVKVHTKTNQTIQIYEFSSYLTALKLLKHLRSLESFEVIDHVAIKLEENHQKRMNRRR